MLSGNNAILTQKDSNMCKPQYTMFRKGHFMPLEKLKKKDFDATIIQNVINASQCGDRCTAFYKEYSTTKSPCPKSLIEPLYQIFKGSSSSWDSVTTDDGNVTQDLENIKAIAQANTFLLEKILNDETYSKFCFHVVKLLFGAYKSILGKGRGFEGDNGGQWSHKDDNDVQGTGKDGTHGKGGKNQDDDHEENGDSHGKDGRTGNGKNGRGNGKAGRNGKNAQNLEDESSGGNSFKTSQIGSIIESMFKSSSGSNNSHDAKGNQDQSIVGEDFSGGSKNGSTSGPHQNLNMSDIFSILNGLKDNGTQVIEDGNNSSMMRTLTDTLKQVLHIAAGNGNNGTGQDSNQQGLKQNQSNQGNFDGQGNQTLGQSNFGGGENMTKLLSILKDIHSNMTMQPNSTGNTSQSPNTNSIKTALKNILDSVGKGQGLAGMNLTGNGSMGSGKSQMGGSHEISQNNQGKSNQGKGSMEMGKRRKRSSREDHMDGNQNMNQKNNKQRGQNGKGFNMGPKQGKGGSGQPKKVMNNYFPFGAWNWGLPDIGLVSGKPNCALLNPNCQNKKLVLDSWYSDCVCPWVWSGKSGTCPYGNEGNTIVAKANILYLKNKPNFPRIRPPFEVFENFTSSIQNSPIDQSDIDFLISSYSEFLQAESNSSLSQLMQSYLENLSPQFKESLLTMLKEIQGKGTFINSNPVFWGIRCQG